MKTLEELAIKIDREKIAAFCCERGIQKMSLFGSVLRDDFDPERSDVDVLVKFRPGVIYRDRLYPSCYVEELSKIIGHPVDFNLTLSFYDKVKGKMMTIYEDA